MKIIKRNVASSAYSKKQFTKIVFTEKKSYNRKY